MKRLNLDNHSPFHKTGHTSKGDQRKWKIGDRWYKADYMGYESLAELSHALKKMTYCVHGKVLSYTVLRKENLFSEKNQELLFKMSQ